MPFEAKPLADGQLPNTKGTLYTVPDARAAYIRLISLHNLNAIAQTVVVYLNVSGTSRVIHRAVMAQYDTVRIESSISLAEGDLIEGVTTTAAAVDYVITGAEET